MVQGLPEETGAEVPAVACPLCLKMLADAVKAENLEERTRVRTPLHRCRKRRWADESVARTARDEGHRLRDEEKEEA
jgi:Fe-S oxidoreductase